MNFKEFGTHVVLAGGGFRVSNLDTKIFRSSTRWWFQIIFFFYVHPLLGEDSHFDEYFSTGLKPPTRLVWARVMDSF